MKFKKTKNVESNLQKIVIDYYCANFVFNTILCEYNMWDFIKKQENNTGKLLDGVLKKRASKLRIDVFDVTKNLVLEIDGDQHNTFTTFYHKTIGDFDRQNMNDDIKGIICDFFGVKLIRVTERNYKEVIVNLMLNII
jgi:hypothetical protein